MTRLSPFTFHPSRLALVAGLLAATPVVASAQTAQQLEMLRQNPELVQQQIQRSGLSAAEIRQRLRAAGYPSTLLDPFLEGEVAPGSAAVSEGLIQSLDVLGVPLVFAEGLEDVPLQTGVGITPAAGRFAGGGLQLFGLNVFRGRTTQFQPLLSGPVPPSYRVGPGDVFVLVLTGDVELVRELSVTREGFIVIPQVGQISVNGLTMAQLNALLRRRLGRSYSGIRNGTTRFDITVARLRTNQIYVVGEVVQPGAYQLASVATVLNALYAAGGPTDRGNFRSIAIQRQGDTVAVLDLYEYLLRGDTRNDVVLEQGDVVFVPLKGVRASITGAISRPAMYELGPRETLADLVGLAGGFEAEADLRRVAVHRILPMAERGPGPAPRAVIDVPLQQAQGIQDTGYVATVPALALEDGDSVVVDAILPLERSLYVSVFGMVNKPGRYPWSEGMTLRDLVLLARGPRVGADLREAEVARLPDDRTGGTLADKIRVPLDSTYLYERNAEGQYVGATGVVFPGAGTAPEFGLEPYDQLTILKQPEFEFQRPVTVTGEVYFAGTYALTNKEERLSDLVQRAGGLTPTAYSEGARFYRTLDNAGRINIDLETAMEQPGSPQDVVLQPGDSLDIPEYIPTVRVTGAVIAPTSVLYKEGAGLEYYVANAGGYARDADKGRVSVRFADGSAEVKRKLLFLASAPEPGPGSVVTVPAVPADEKVDVNQLLGTFAQIVTGAVAIIAIVVR